MQTICNYSLIINFLLIISLWNLFACNTPTSTPDQPTVIDNNNHPTGPLIITACDSAIVTKDHQLNSFTYSNYNFVIGPGRVRLGGNSFVQEERQSSKHTKGVQVAVNINNSMQTTSNENIFEHRLENGKYNFFAFIVSPFNESLKQETAILAKEIEIINGNLSKSNPIPSVALVYNSPRGTFAMGEKILLDFVLINTNIKEGGNSVTVTIDDSYTYSISQWTAHYIEGLSKGNHKIELELLDATKRSIASTVSETITIQ